MLKRMKRHETIIVGGGPIGLEIAASLQMAGNDCLVLDSGSIGSTIDRLFPPNTRFFSSPERLQIAGVACSTVEQEKITREEYLCYLRQVVDTIGLDVRTFHHVESVTRGCSGFEVAARARSGAPREFHSDRLVLATGGMARVRTLGIEGESMPHVRHDLGDPHQYHGRRVLIVGGRNSACEAAIRCWRSGAHVHLCHRNDVVNERVKYWIRPELIALMKEGRITEHARTTLERITEDHAQLVSTETGDTTRLEVDDVLLMIGYEHDPSLMHHLGVRTDAEDGSPSFDVDTMLTNVDNLHVAGTATAGTQDRFRVYIENCHIHADRIVSAITGTDSPRASDGRLLEES